MSWNDVELKQLLLLLNKILVPLKLEEKASLLNGKGQIQRGKQFLTLNGKMKSDKK